MGVPPPGTSTQEVKHQAMKYMYVYIAYSFSKSIQSNLEGRADKIKVVSTIDQWCIIISTALHKLYTKYFTRQSYWKKNWIMFSMYLKPWESVLISFLPKRITHYALSKAKTWKFHFQHHNRNNTEFTVRFLNTSIVIASFKNRKKSLIYIKITPNTDAECTAIFSKKTLLNKLPQV